MITLGYCFFHSSSFLITVSRCFRVLVIFCGLLFVIILIFALIVLYQFYHLKPVKVVENVYVPAPELKDASKKSSKSKKLETEETGTKPATDQCPPKQRKRKLNEEAKVGLF